ncbi:MMPL family transporter [Modestobacter sp. I12A-02628]|uniref:MMPL family transporter n=1 Tax=Goekera deserti TaxID=2497753 RepID=A0A7K3WFR4_9ACTN|nr:MMPL family transporter [Goekera deserti]MPR00403.1 MMPL family transporter [Goekera deserti]NDI50393.1 MMPL family transporter [Goekera deserti]NEL55341.1 MMPL family transporter [Goekera deserti]
MSTLLYRLGRAAYHRRRLVSAVWVAVVGLVVALLLTVGSQSDDAFTIPGSESQTALDQLREASPAAAGASASVLFAAPDGQTVTAPQYVQAIGQVVAAAGQVTDVGAVTDPFATQALSRDGRAALVTVQYDVEGEALAADAYDELTAATAAARDAGLQVEVGGQAFSTTGVAVGPTELVGVLVAVVVLAVTLGSLLAAGMNLLIALVGVLVGLGGLLLSSNVLTLSSSAPTLALMIGLAVGIDYSLFILSRHRSQLAAGLDPAESVARAAGTAGSAVVFAGLTVIIALSGLSVVGIPFLTVMGLGAAGTVLVAVLVALTLLPALLGFAGARLTPEPGSRAGRREQALAAEDGRPARFGGARWGALVTRRPLVTVLVTVIGLLVMAVPALQLRLALPDASTAAEDSPQRQAYDAVSEYFGPGLNGPLLLLLDGLDPAGAQDAANAAAVAVGGVPTDRPGEFDGGLDDVVVATPQVLPDGTTAIVQVVPESGPQEQATTDLVADLRSLAPQLEQQTGAEVAVTGQTAIAIDVSDRLQGALLPFALIVVGLAVVLLMLVFRSVLVPVKAALGFLLSVGASFGAVVAVFQWGWLADLFGVPATGPVISFMPILLMAVLFGLAMDYEVFLVSRMREEYVHGAAPRDAVVGGMRHASRVVVAAALIMLSVFASFVTIEDVTIKAIAFGLAVGVLVDAFVVRMTLVPAVLALLSRSAWWLPRGLDRVLPDLDVEGARLERPAPPVREPQPAG